MNRMVAGAFVLAGCGALFEHLRDDERVGESLRAADSFALSRSLWLVVGLCAIGTALTWWLVRAPERVEAAVVAPSPSRHGHHGHHF